MRIVKTIILAIVAVILVSVALANAQTVTLRFVPEAMAGFLGMTWAVTLPMFVVVLAAVGVGLLIGFLLEFAREHKHRAAARHERREREALEREMTRMKTQRPGTGDDILALLEDGSVPRQKAS
jgi:lipopolysaccharide assembly protein A